MFIVLLSLSERWIVLKQEPQKCTYLHFVTLKYAVTKMSTIQMIYKIVMNTWNRVISNCWCPLPAMAFKWLHIFMWQSVEGTVEIMPQSTHLEGLLFSVCVIFHYLYKARMGPETETLEPVLAVCLSVELGSWLAGMFVQEICPRIYGKCSALILMYICNCLLLHLTHFVFPDIAIALVSTSLSATYLISI